MDELRLLSDRYWMSKVDRTYEDITASVLNKNLETTIIEQNGNDVSPEQKLVAVSVAS